MSTDQNVSNPPDRKPTVTIFGAGIAGLTAAHELAERGFDVLVVEPDDPDPFLGGPCAIGGLARSRRASVSHHDALPGPAAARARELDLGQASPIKDFIPDLIRFLWKKPDLDETNTAIVKALADRLKAAGFTSVLVRGYSDPSEQGEGTHETPQVYSQRRAEAVRDCLNNQGLTVTLCQGYGVEYPPPGQDLATMPYRKPIQEQRFVEIRPDVDVLHGEHGFRFFPSFYRHVFDTMRRTRITGFHHDQATFRTVYDNLVASQGNYIALEGPRAGSGGAGKLRHGLELPSPGPNGSFFVARSRASSIAALRSQLEEVLGPLGYTPADLARLEVKILKYLTSSIRRRRTEYEKISWYDFLSGGDLDDSCRKDTLAFPEIMGASNAQRSEARTQGSCAVQLLLDQFTDGTHVDSVLNGPTTDAWFRPWRRYLEAQGVRFCNGALVGACEDEHGAVLPEVSDLIDGELERARSADFFLVAISLAGWSEDVSGRDCPKLPADPGNRLIDRFAGFGGDFKRIEAMVNFGGNWNDPDNNRDGAQQNLIGIQFFFDAPVQLARGHIVYLDSAWRLSSIAQAQFWARAQFGHEGWRGVVSVCIGKVARDPEESPGSSYPWGMEFGKLATQVWTAIENSLGDPNLPRPRSFFIDDAGADQDCPDRSTPGTLSFNDEPYLVNLKDQFVKRPGEARYKSAGDCEYIFYRAQTAGRNWFLAGTYMKTHTRLTTMESANESARHAVNSLLRRWKGRYEKCAIWNPEDREPEDLRPLRRLDAALMADPEGSRRHVFDRIPVDAVIDALVPSSSRSVLELIQDAIFKFTGRSK